MSLRERLKQVGSPEELRAVMNELAESGSRNWTYLTVTRFVPDALRGELDAYFDEQGRLRPPSHVGAGPSDDAADPEGGWTTRRGGDGSLSTLIARFHRQLREVRAAAVADLDPVDDGEGAVEAVETVAAATEAAPDDVEETAAEPELFLCPICETRTAADTVVFRGTEMCEPCADLLRYGPR